MRTSAGVLVTHIKVWRDTLVIPVPVRQGWTDLSFGGVVSDTFNLSTQGADLFEFKDSLAYRVIPG